MRLERDDLGVFSEYRVSVQLLISCIALDADINAIAKETKSIFKLRFIAFRMENEAYLQMTRGIVPVGVQVR